MTETEKIRRLTEALEWYRDEARAIANNSKDKTRTDALMASVHVLSLDGGRRADEAMQNS